MNEINRCNLTGFPTGESLDDALRALIHDSAGDGWIFFVRVDQIEHINAVYGRDEGDTTFRRIGEILQAGASIEMYRHEGPIFVATLVGDTAEALTLGEYLRKVIADSSELIETVTVSIALIAADEVDDIDDAYAIAKTRLQNARRRGGNTVSAVSHTDDEDEFSSGTVLIVDPEIELLTIVIREIESRGITVMTATDGLEALQIVSQFAPDVVISELSVPKIGGFELRSRLRSMERVGNVPFVLLSHRQTDDLIREAAALRILHYYRKPVAALLIAELVHNLVRARTDRERY